MNELASYAPGPGDNNFSLFAVVVLGAVLRKDLDDFYGLNKPLDYSY